MKNGDKAAYFFNSINKASKALSLIKNLRQVA